jgi:hypothetical protein
MGNMNINEIYILNSAIDGVDVPFLPPLASLAMSSQLGEAVKSGLIQKGILESETSFATEGVRLTYRLKKYKEAEKYVKIGSAIFGLLSDKEGILILQNALSGQYKIERIDTSAAVDQLREVYAFLRAADDAPSINSGREKGVSQGKSDAKSLSTATFQKRYDLQSYEHFHIITKKADAETDEICFQAEMRRYIYDCISETLSEISLEHLLETLEERMKIA